MCIGSTVPNQFSELKSDNANRRGKALNNLCIFPQEFLPEGSVFPIWSHFFYDFAIGLYLIQYTSLHIDIDYQVVVFDINTYKINEFHLFSSLKI